MDLVILEMALLAQVNICDQCNKNFYHIKHSSQISMSALMDQMSVTLMLSVAIQLAVMSALVQWDILGVASIAVCTQKC